MKFILIALALILASVECLNLRQVSPCSGPNAALSLQNFVVSPIPIIHPGIASVTLKVELLRGLIGKIKTKVNLVRTVNGLSLNVRCFLANEFYYGSCTYDDICEMVEAYHEAVHPGESLDVHGLACPYDFAPGLYDENWNIDLPSISLTDISFLSGGIYDLTLEANDAFGQLGCVNLKFATAPA